MKKVIFICLLSLSVCLSKPENQPAGSPPPALPNDAAAAANSGAQTKTPEPATKPADPAPKPVEPSPKPDPADHKSSSAPVPVPDTKNQTASTNNETKPNNTTPNANGNNTHEDGAKGNNIIDPAKGTKNDTAENKNIINNKTKTDDKNGKENGSSVTPKTDGSTKPTEAPKPAEVLQARGFDGASFIGGIILTLGLLAIGFMGFKYYKNQTERNYHTL